MYNKYKTVNNMKSNVVQSRKIGLGFTFALYYI